MVVEEPAHGKAVGALFLVGAEHERARISLLREKLKGCLAAAFEWSDAVVLAGHLVALALLEH